MSAYFKIEYKKLAVLLLPTFMRKPLIFGFIRAAIKPIMTLHATFLANRNDNIYKVNQTGQVCYLRGMLNDAFDFDQRRIFIGSGEGSDWVMTEKEATFNTTDGGKAVMLMQADEVITDKYGNKTLVYNSKLPRVGKQGNVKATGSDFTVQVPMSLRGQIDENRIIALVNYYKLASKRYNIQYY